jgi:outer membrane protein assembly factor BamE (lipoprotein component of BamABCDE complex)
MVQRLRAQLLGVIAVACMTSACTATIYVHRTIEGQPFRFEGLTELRQGMTSDAVRLALGEPLDVAESGDLTLWRYFERANPRWCDGGSSKAARPEYSVDAVLVFRNDSLLLHNVRRRGEPQFP